MRLAALTLALALACVVLAVASPGAAGAAAPPLQAPPMPTAARPHAHEMTTPIDLSPRRVSWSYDVLYHPHLVASVLRDVAAGKTPRSTIATLASAETTEKLLHMTWPQRSPPAKGPANAPAPRGQSRQQAATAAASEWGILTQALAGQPEYSPKQLKLPDAYDKEVKRAIVWFTATADGHVTATIPTGAPPFRIHEIISYDGSFENTPHGPTLKAWDWRTSAPFDLSVRAGQIFAVVVEFAPVFDLFGGMTAGQKTGKLEVKDDTFTVNIPISAMFQGVHIAGVALTPTEDTVTVDTYLPGANYRFSTQVQILNVGADPRTATITADSLPGGVTLVGSPTVSLGPGESKAVDVTFALNGGSYGYGQQAALRATAPGGLTSTTSISMNIVRSDVEWEADGGDYGVTFAIIYRLASDGHWNVSASEWNNGVFVWDGTAQLVLGGMGEYFPINIHLGTLTDIDGPHIASQVFGWQDAGPGGVGGWSKNYYAELIQKKANLSVNLHTLP